MKPHVLVTRKIFAESLAQLSAHCRVTTNQRDVPWTPRQLQDRLKGKDAVVCLLTDAISDAVLQRHPQLRVVSNVAVGFNNVDVGAATRHGVLVTNTPGVLDGTTADFTWCLILATARRVVEADRVFRSGRWTGWGVMQFLGTDVYGQTLGVCGFGRIGREVARRAAGFDMRVLYTDVQRAPASVERRFKATYANKARLLRDADVVTLHVPLLAGTRHYIGERELQLMKPTALLVNAARGPVVDERALVRALKQGRIAAAGLDVYEREPKPVAGLTALPNTVLAPHIASASTSTRRRMSDMAVENCLAGLAGRRPKNLVNPDVWAHRR